MGGRKPIQRAPREADGAYPGELGALKDYIEAMKRRPYKRAQDRKAATTKDGRRTFKVVRPSTGYETWKSDPHSYDLQGIDTHGTADEPFRPLRLSAVLKAGGPLEESATMETYSEETTRDEPETMETYSEETTWDEPVTMETYSEETVRTDPITMETYSEETVRTDPVTMETYSEETTVEPPLEWTEEELAEISEGEDDEAEVKTKVISQCHNTHDGWRQHQEDRALFTSHGPWTLMGVFDGHGGSVVSTELQRIFERMFLPNMTRDAPAQLIKAYFRGFDELLQQMYPAADKQGSTASLALVDRADRALYLINLGDSRTIAVQEGKVVQATRDHKPQDIEEIAHVEQQGGKIWGGRVFGQLATTRAFGDFALKPGVSAVPSVYGPIPIDKRTTIVSATDGLWDVLSNEEVAQVVVDHRENQTEVCERLVDMALKRGTRDNVTAVVSTIEPLAPPSTRVERQLAAREAAGQRERPDIVRKCQRRLKQLRANLDDKAAEIWGGVPPAPAKLPTRDLTRRTSSAERYHRVDQLLRDFDLLIKDPRVEAKQLQSYCRGQLDIIEGMIDGLEAEGVLRRVGRFFGLRGN